MGGVTMIDDKGNLRRDVARDDEKVIVFDHRVPTLVTRHPPRLNRYIYRTNHYHRPGLIGFIKYEAFAGNLIWSLANIVDGSVGSELWDISFVRAHAR